MNSIKKWNDILEELLQCCVCLELSNTMILQCQSGHHICNFCRRKLQNCPICKNIFIETRNLLAEQLISGIKDIQLAIGKEIMEKLEQSNYKQQFANTSTQTDIVFKSCSTTQTDKIKYTDNEQKNDNIPRQVVHYPCLNCCAVNMSYTKLMNHLKQYHTDIFYEVCQDNKIFSKDFEIHIWKLPTDYDQVFSITNMGLFFVKITIHNNGLSTNLQIVDKDVETIRFEYRIVILSEKQYLRRRGMVTSCLVDKKIAYQYNICINRSDMLQMIKTKSFKCTLIIKKLEYPIKLSNTGLTT